MAKIAIVTDSSSSLQLEEAKKLGVEIAPLSVYVDEKESRDLYDITPREVLAALHEEKDIKTSQPNLGSLDELFGRLKAENYDHILVFSIASYLSGTYQAFELAARSHDLNNVTVIDSKTAAGPLQYVAIKAREMANDGKGVEEILAMADNVFAPSKTFILPESIKQLVKGGRVKGPVAALINLLKVRLGLYLDANVTTIEKFDTARTDLKLFASVYADIVKNGYTAEDTIIYLPSCEATSRVEAFKKYVLDKEPNARFKEILLPAAVAAHVGLGAFGIQTVKDQS